jgi:hypothetical protein
MEVMNNDSGNGGNPSGAGPVLGPLIAALLDEQMRRKTSIEQRALAVISSSGVLVSLLVALTAFLISDDATLPVATQVTIALSVVSFVTAAVIALWVNTPRRYEGFSEQDLQRMTSDGLWNSESEEARRIIAEQQAREVTVSLNLNNKKGRAVQWAIAAEVLGVGLVASGILSSLTVGT